MNAGVPRALLSVSSPSSIRPSSSARDVFWERALSGLPDQLLTALRAAELDEPGVLLEYPMTTAEELKGTMGEALGDHVAPSGAASSAQPTISSSDSCSAASTTPWVASGMVASGVVECKGTDPRTGLSFVPSGGEVKTDHRGTDPKTGFVPSGGEVKTDQHVPSGGEVKTDHCALDWQMICSVGGTDDSPRPGGLATQTATPDPPACTDFTVSRSECRRTS